MKISAQEQGTSTAGEKKKKKKAWRRIVAVAELPHECSSLNKM